ncbi:MAG: histidine--tRNA ligase [Candidatus Dadabacteria bacterium]|nr:histidine--tRNA ligase [Candidatus Dadabacteria bacterium]
MKIARLHGFKDICYPETEKLRLVESSITDVFKRFGFSEITIPILELSGVYSTGLGDTTDIVQKEMYTFETKGGEWVSMRPEGTAGVVRAFIENSLYRKSPVTKLYYSGEMFRYEKPQEGRQRSFNQIGAELFGSRDPLADSDIIAMLWLAITELGLSDHVKLELNSIGKPLERERYKESLIEFLSPKKDSLCENCQNRLSTNPLRILDCKTGACREVTSDIPFSIHDHLSEQSREHLDALLFSLREKSIPYRLNHRIVRGLDYYTDTVFEVTTDKLGSQNAVAAGGRYDLLVERMGGPQTPAVGFAMGVERIMLLLEKTGTRRNSPGKKQIVCVIHIGENARGVAVKIADGLRKKGLRVETEYENKSLKSQMRKANRTGATYSVIIGEDELRKDLFSLRNMKTGEEKSFPLKKLADLEGHGDFRKLL